MKEPPGPHDPDEIVMPALLVACPSFAQDVHTHVADGPDAKAPGIYVELGAFAEHLVSMLGRGETSEFQGVFATVERLLAGPDEGVRYAVKIGLLEAVGNIASHQHDRSFAARFRPWFGPSTAEAWDEIHRFWGTSDRG